MPSASKQQSNRKRKRRHLSNNNNHHTMEQQQQQKRSNNNGNRQRRRNNNRNHHNYAPDESSSNSTHARLGHSRNNNNNNTTTSTSSWDSRIRNAFGLGSNGPVGSSSTNGQDKQRQRRRRSRGKQSHGRHSSSGKRHRRGGSKKERNAQKDTETLLPKEILDQLLYHEHHSSYSANIESNPHLEYLYTDLARIPLPWWSSNTAPVALRRALPYNAPFYQPIGVPNVPPFQQISHSQTAHHTASQIPHTSFHTLPFFFPCTSSSTNYPSIISNQGDSIPSDCFINSKLDRIIFSMGYVYRCYQAHCDSWLRPYNQQSPLEKYLHTDFSHTFTGEMHCEQVTDSKWANDDAEFYFSLIGTDPRLVQVTMNDEGPPKETNIWSSSQQRHMASLLSFDIGHHSRIALGLSKSLRVIQNGRSCYSMYSPFQSDIIQIRFLAMNDHSISAIARDGTFSLHDIRTQHSCLSHQWNGTPAIQAAQLTFSPYQFLLTFLNGKSAIYDSRWNMKKEIVTVCEGDASDSLQHLRMRLVLHGSIFTHANPVTKELNLYDVSQTASSDMLLMHKNLPNKPMAVNYDAESHRVMCMTEDYTAHWFQWGSSTTGEE